MTLSAGSRLGPYEIVTPLGAGGMGEVYGAKDPRLGREVAVKVLPASFSTDADRLRRFEQEARAAGLLNHPNITAVYDIGTHDGAPYVVSELLEGETLRAPLAGGRPSMRRAVDWATQIAQGLAAAHVSGRDVPARVHLMEVSTGKKELWKEFLPADSAGVAPFGAIRITPDGKSYAYSFLRVLSELFVVEGVR